MQTGLLLIGLFFLLAPFVASKVVDYCELHPRAKRGMKVAIGVLCMLFVLDVLIRLTGTPVFDG